MGKIRMYFTLSLTYSSYFSRKINGYSSLNAKGLTTQHVIQGIVENDVYSQATCTSVLWSKTAPILFLATQRYSPASVRFNRGTKSLKTEQKRCFYV